MVRPSRSRSGSRTPSRTPSRSRSRSPRRSRSRSRSTIGSRSRSRTPSRSRSPTPTASLGNHPKDDFDQVTVSYEDFVAADEETPTFALESATIDLVRTKVYQAPALNKKFFNELKKEKYMMAKDVNESLEPKPIPPQVVSSVAGFDLHKLHGGLLHQHKVSRLAQRPIWSLMEQLQRSRKFLRDSPTTQFVSPPYMGVGTPPEGFAPLQYSDEDARQYVAQANPAADVADLHKRLGAHIKYHADAERSMLSMTAVIKKQQEFLGHIKGSLETMWGRTQDYLNMSRYQETHLKDMRRSQLVKAHTREFTEWLEVYMKDKSRLGERDKSDEILAADYDAVIKQFNEDRKNKNIALRSSRGHGRGRDFGGGGRGGGNSRDRQPSNKHADGSGSSRNNDPSSAGGGKNKPRNDQRKGRDRNRKPGGSRGGADGGKPDASGGKKGKTP